MPGLENAPGDHGVRMMGCGLLMGHQQACIWKDVVVEKEHMAGLCFQQGPVHRRGDRGWRLTNPAQATLALPGAQKQFNGRGVARRLVDDKQFPGLRLQLQKSLNALR